MSDDFRFDESDILNGTLHINDEELDEEYEEHLRTERQAAVAEAMQEALEGFSSFEDSSCEDEDTSSEDDVPETCNSVTPPESFHAGFRLNPSTHALSPTIKTQIRSHSIPEGLNRRDLFTQSHGSLVNGGGKEHHRLWTEAHCLSASVDSLMKVGTQPDTLSCLPSSLCGTDITEGHHQSLDYVVDSPDQNYVKVHTGFHHQVRDYNHNCKDQRDIFRPENMDWNLVSDDMKENIQFSDSQPWTNKFSDALQKQASTADSVTASHVDQEFQPADGNNCLPGQVGYHIKSEVVDVGNMDDRNADDDWMLLINKPVKASSQSDHPRYPDSHHQFNHHHHRHQLPRQTAENGQDSKLKLNLLVQSASVHQSTSLTTTKLVPTSIAAPQMSAAPPGRQGGTTARRDVRTVPQMSRNTDVHDGGDGQLAQYKVHYEKPGLCKLEEEQFYLDSENVDFLQLDGPDDQRTNEQLMILYRARGREIEELTQKMEEKDEEKSKEIRNLKHRLAIASGEAEAVNESLRQGQQLLQQSKSDHSEACGKIRALETQVSSLRDTREELIKKLQITESTIENLTHHVEELQESESLSRARNEHEAVIASLTSRHGRELLVVREKLDVCKTSVDIKQEELSCVKKQLTDMTRELELVQMSKAETVNRLTRSLEESQRQCQAILEQSSSPEVSMMKVQLQQVVASKRVSEDLCQTFQREIKELKEQLNMFESASQLGVFTSSSSSSANIPSHDDSMTDLGIRKTLTFDSPQSVTRHEDIPASEKLIASLKSELERCLHSNRQKRSEVMEKAEEVKILKEELEETRSRVASLEKTCADQKVRLQELDSLNKPGGGGVGPVEARLQREVEDLKRERNALLADVEDYKTRLQEVGDSEAKLAEINAELSQQIAQMVNDFDQDKQSALQSYQRTMEAVNQHSFDKLHLEMQERFQSEKTMLMDDSKRKLENLNQALRSTQAELDKVKSLYVKTCEEHSQREGELQERYRTQLEEELAKITEKLEKEKQEWEHFMRDQLEKDRDQIRNSLRQTIELEFKEESQRQISVKVAEVKLACIEEQRLVRQTMVEESLADARKLWQMEHERDFQQWMEERNDYESKLSKKNDELSEYKQKLDLSVSEKETFKKLAEDLKLDHQTTVESLEKKHQKEMKDILVKHDRQIQQAEDKVSEMIHQFSSSADNKSGSVADVLGSFQGSDLLGKLQFLENVMSDKDGRLQELEKNLQGQKAALLLGVSKDGSNGNDLNGSFADLESYHGELFEANAEKLKEHIKMLESELHTMKQKCNKEVNELKQQHQKEFENASRLREDKFQSELRYFLKEKEDECKIRMETAMKQCGSQARLQQDQVLKEADEKHTCVMHETICEYESKIAKLQEIIIEHEERISKDTKQSVFKTAEDTVSLRDKMKREISVVEEKYNTEKSTLEKKMKQMEEEKDDEIVNLCLRQAEEERKLKEQFDSYLASLKADYQNIIKKFEQELFSHRYDTNKARELTESLQKENQSNTLLVEELKTEVEQMKAKLSNKQSLTEQIKELRAKWFLEAQEYINKEIIQGVEGEIKKEEWKVGEKLEKIKKEEQKVRQQLETIREEEKKIRVKQEKITEEERRISEKWEKIQEETRKMRENLEKIKGDEKKVRDKLEKITEDDEKIREKLEKINEEEEKMKKKQEAIKEWEKNKEIFEREKKEELRKIIQVELENLKKKFVVELNARVEAMKSQLEQEKIAWQEEERQTFLMEKERIIQTLHSDMERSLQEAKLKIELKMEKLKENQLWEMRNEMQGEMRKRIQSVREEWEREREYDDNRDRVELNRLKECLQAEFDMRNKACQERDKAVDHMKYHEFLFREKEQSLMLALKKCQQGEKEASKRQEAVAEQVTNADRKYKINVNQVKAQSNQMSRPDARNQASQKSQHPVLDTAASSRADPLTQISSALSPMSAPVAGKQVIDIFNFRAKTNIRTALSQQVPENMITALEHSLDLLSERVKSMAAKGSVLDPASSRPGSDTSDNLRQQPSADLINTNRQTNCQICRDQNMLSSDQILVQHHFHPGQNKHKQSLEEEKWHPQLDKVDLFDSDWYHNSATSSNRSSPVSQTHSRTDVKSVAKNHKMAARNMQTFNQNEVATGRTSPAKLAAANENNEEFSGLPSARHDRTFAEAKVRLETWTQTGEMPWKTSRKMSATQHHDGSCLIKPRLDAERWVGQQGDNSNFSTNGSKDVNIIKQEQNCYILTQVPMDGDSENSFSSDDASTSFMTLQSDIDPIAARTHFNSLKFLKNGNTAFVDKDDHLHAEGQVFRENEHRAQLSEYNLDIDCESRRPVCHGRSQNASTGYSRRCLTPPPSSVLTKVKMTDYMRTRSEEDNSGIQWKNIGGPLTCDLPKNHTIHGRNLEPRESSRSKFRSCSSPPNSSHLKTNSRSKSANRNNGDLVTKSTEISSGTSRIDQNAERTNLWRYKSLEELMPSLNQQNYEMKTSKLDKSTMERTNMYAEDGHAPVVAMTSRFWEQQCGNDTAVTNGQHDYVRQPGYSQSSSETKHKKETNKFITSIFNQNSSATRHQISKGNKKQLSGNAMNVEFEATNQNECDFHSQPCFRKRSTRTRDVAGLRRSLEEEQLSQYYQLSSAHEDARKSKMTRALSEQSLHMLHFEKDCSQGQGQDPGSHIDDLVSTYTSSHFDLRPFVYDEHF